ncbi:MAG: 2-hydroxychromene-2-carboxylate isomerase [Deltaproteobacteria bacterium]|nr:2-hydroxychromene-2-carboxylate isomerase [Deltaproteobacteria bacterium]
MRVVDLWLDPISPYAWLAGRQLDRIDALATVRVRPVLFAALLNHHGNVGPAEIPTKRAYTFRDVVRTADRLGLRVEGPPAHPFNPLTALRACVSIEDDASRRRLAVALMDAAWSEGRDLESIDVVRDVAAQLGLDGEAIVAATRDPAIKQRLLDATQEAISVGVFGVPSFVIEGEVFWGSDRLDALVHRLEGHRVEEAKLARILARPASATRR